MLNLLLWNIAQLQDGILVLEKCSIPSDFVDKIKSIYMSVRIYKYVIV